MGVSKMKDKEMLIHPKFIDLMEHVQTCAQCQRIFAETLTTMQSHRDRKSGE